MIEPGDLVVVVHACCEETASAGLGWVFTAATPFEYVPRRCVFCGTPFEGRASAERQSAQGLSCAPLAWLRKIRPLTEEESTEGVESVHAQA